ncbi:protein FRG1 [Planococcus citri]|uniref:protein FRG1 n=1 Tax=Planococcus citri TaxID=170843 RepID=UPI0031F87D13
MSEYEVAKKGKLVLKGEKKGLKRKKKHKDKKEKSEGKHADTDLASHGGWCKADLVSDITGNICIEFGNHTYIKALDNGCFTIGPPHDEGDGPSPEEVLTAVVISETKVAFKSGYGKYLGYNKDGSVIGKADAIGPLEQWEPIFQDGKLALLSSNGCFMSIQDSDDSVVVTSRKAGDKEIVQVRYFAADREKDPLEDIPVEERGDLKEVEMNYVKKFQKFQDKKLRVCSGGYVKLKKAKDEGKLHEAFLDRRCSMKSDRGCK